jgi:hypothetical protein
MVPQFNSTELNQLLTLELAEGAYGSAEDALLAGLRVLREGREFRAQLDDRFASLRDGRAVELDSDESLGIFLDAIDAEVDAEINQLNSPNS